MAYEIRDGQGSLFKNDHRTTDSHPNAKGKAMVGGRMFWVSAWTKTKADGEKWQSLAFQPVEESKSEDKPDIRPAQEIIEDDVPF